MEIPTATEGKALGAARNVGIATILFRSVLAQRTHLSLTESLCLTVLGLRGSATPTELARLVGLSTGSMTTLLDRLEERGIIRRRPRPGDRRGLLVEVAEGHQKDSFNLVSGIQEAQKRLASEYSPEQLELIASFLNRYADNLRDQAQNLLPEFPWPLEDSGERLPEGVRLQSLAPTE